MGTYIYKGNTKTYHTINMNNKHIERVYKIINGYFGSVGKQGSNKIREIRCDDPLLESKKFYDTLSYGGIEFELLNGKGLKTVMKDGTIIVYRKMSSSGSPAVDINISSNNSKTKIKSQKIHFERSK